MKDKFIKPYCIKVKYYSINPEGSFELVDLYLNFEEISGYYIGAEGNITLLWKGMYLDCEYQTWLIKLLKEYFNPMSFN